MTDFIIIGTRNGLFYKDVFPFVQEGKITLGYTHLFKEFIGWMDL